jgi:hypothetical protein
MATIAIQNQRGSLRARTFDSIAPTAVTGAPDVDVGSRYDGTGKTPREVDLAALRAARDTSGLLSPGALAEINAILKKYSGKAAAGSTGAAGITSNDSGQRDHIRSVAKSYNDFWNANIARHRASALGG